MKRALFILLVLGLAAHAAAKPQHAKAPAHRASKRRTPVPTAVPTPAPTALPTPEDRPGAAAPNDAQRAAARTLDVALDRVLAQDRYTWRSDREAKQALGENLALQTLHQGLVEIGHLIEKGLRKLGSGLRKAWDWLEERLRGGNGREDPAGPHPGVSAPSDGAGELWAGLGLVALAASVLGLFVYRRARQLAPIAAAPVPAALGDLDLQQPELRGDELPEEAWLALAARLAAEGQGRLALRAYYLAALNALGRGGLLRLAACRSVGEYRRQLQRRGAEAALRERFQGFSGLYEHAWFGTLAVGPGELARAASDQEALRGAAR
jgi:hypothetical protein